MKELGGRSWEAKLKKFGERGAAKLMKDMSKKGVLARKKKAVEKSS